MMKKLLLVTFIFTVFSVLTQAQSKKIFYGLKAGYNMADFSGDVKNTKILSSFHAGGFVEIPVLSKLSIQPEIVYSEQGKRHKLENYESKSHVNYINVPVLAKYYITDAFSVEAGPQIGFLVKSEDEDNFGKYDYKDETKSIDFALVLGLSYRLPINLFFSARYNYGLSNFNKLEDSDYKMINQVGQLSVGYRF